MNNFDVNGFLLELHKKNFLKNFLIFISGVLLSSLAFNLFYQRYNIVVVGSSGLSVLLYNGGNCFIYMRFFNERSSYAFFTDPDPGHDDPRVFRV